MSNNTDPGYPEPPLEVPVFEMLSPEQQEAIKNGPRWVKNPVELGQFDDLDHFVRDSNNFFTYFSNSEIAQYAYKSAPFYQRFEIVFPELNKELNDLVQAMPEQDRRVVHEPHIAPKLFEAYKLMSQLVDKEDERAMINDKEVNTYVLCN